MSQVHMNRRSWFQTMLAPAALSIFNAHRTDAAQIGPNDSLKVSKIESFVLTNTWVFVKISTDAGIVGWGEMLKDDAKACAAGALEVADYLVGKDPRRVVHHWQAIHRGAFYRGGPIKTAISSGIDQALWDITGKAYGVPVYKLFGLSPLGTRDMPGPNQPLRDGHIGYHVRAGRHDLTAYDWACYMDFADKHWGRPGSE